jgi:uncharacterized membrane protein
MNSELIVLRIVHILAGVFWVGAALYLALLLEPRLRGLGRDVEQAVLTSISRLNSLWITGSAVVTIVFGLTLIARTPSRGFDQLFSTGWGVAISIGLFASLAAFLLSGYVGAQTARLRRSLSGESQADAISSNALRRRIALFSRLNAALVVIAVGAMASARYV